jgi:hypothetical protein
MPLGMAVLVTTNALRVAQLTTTPLSDHSPREIRIAETAIQGGSAVWPLSALAQAVTVEVHCGQITGVAQVRPGHALPGFQVSTS